MSTFLATSKKQFEYYKQLGEKSFSQLEEPQLFAQTNVDSNSIAMIVNHMVGNMLSRWTDFLTTDGEKSWRNRDREFEAIQPTRNELLQQWQKGWQCLFDALNSIDESDLSRIVYIRNEGHTVQEAIVRQIAHYSYHVGQLVFAAKQLKQTPWQSLSIPRNASESYNAEKFSNEKSVKYFTDDEMKKGKNDNES